MADKFYFSRDTEVYLAKDSSKWLIPVLDGFSFSQGTNTSEITLNEMADGSGNSRRSRQLFTDSYAPAEWSFQTYLRPLVATYQKKRSALKAKKFKKKLMRKRYGTK